jgi:hypothetical protein
MPSGKPALDHASPILTPPRINQSRLPIARIVSASIRDKDNNRLLHDEIIPYGCNPSDAPCDLTCFIDGVLGINKAAQLDDALASFHTDLE